MKNRVTLWNMISGLLLQLCAIINGMIIPKIILSEFGSETNGLVNSLLQFLSYISLVEGGITGVVAANLYKPIISGDYQKLSSVMVTARRFFFRIGIIYVFYSVVLGVVYPLAMGLHFGYVFTLTLILSLMMLIQYLFSLSYQVLLNADKKGYIVNFTQIIMVLFNILLAYVSVRIYPSIHFMKLITGVLYILQPIVYGLYIHKTYPLNWSASIDNCLMKERWNGAAINIAAFIHGSTDVTVLTMFTDLKTVSVYTVYALITTGLKRLISSLTAGINPSIGHAYARGDMHELNRKMDIYEYITLFLVFFSFTLAGLLITPFVMLYTSGIEDASYYQPVFGYLLVLSEALYLLKLPHLNYAYSANRFKEITKAAYMESVLNVFFSVILVRFYGLSGVAVGTSIAMLYRMIYHVNFTSREIPERHPWCFYRKILIHAVVAAIGILICRILFPISTSNAFQWLGCAFVYTAIFLILYLVSGAIFFRKEMMFFADYLRMRKSGEGR